MYGSTALQHRHRPHRFLPSCIAVSDLLLRRGTDRVVVHRHGSWRPRGARGLKKSFTQRHKGGHKGAKNNEVYLRAFVSSFVPLCETVCYPAILRFWDTGSFAMHSLEQNVASPELRLSARSAGIQVPQRSQRMSLLREGIFLLELVDVLMSVTTFRDCTIFWMSCR